MADEFDTTTQGDDWDIDSLLKEFEPEVEEAEKEADDQTAKLTKAVRKVAERQAKSEERARVEKLTGEFYEKATPEEKELADVLLAGVSDEGRVKKMLDLAKAKAQALGKGDAESAEEAEEAAEESESAQAFSPPAVGPAPRVKDPDAELLERIAKGGKDADSALLEALYPGGVGSLIAA